MRQLLPGTLLTGEMCRVRWSHYVGPMANGLKKGESWNKAEVCGVCVYVITATSNIPLITCKCSAINPHLFYTSDHRCRS